MGRQVKGKPASMKVKIKKETPKVNDLQVILYKIIF